MYSSQVSISQNPNYRLHRRSMVSLTSHTDVVDSRRQHLGPQLLRHTSLYTPPTNNMPSSTDWDTRSLPGSHASSRASVGGSASRSSVITDQNADSSKPLKKEKGKKKKNVEKSSTRRHLDQEENTPLGLVPTPNPIAPGSGAHQYVLAYPNQHQIHPHHSYHQSYPAIGSPYMIPSAAASMTGYPTSSPGFSNPGNMAYMDPVYGYSQSGAHHAYMLSTNPSAPALMNHSHHVPPTASSSSSSSDTHSVRGGTSHSSNRKNPAKRRSVSQMSRASAPIKSNASPMRASPQIGTTQPSKIQPKSTVERRPSDDMPLGLVIEQNQKKRQSSSQPKSAPVKAPKSPLMDLDEDVSISAPFKKTETDPSPNNRRRSSPPLLPDLDSLAQDITEVKLQQDATLSLGYLDFEFDRVKSSLLTSALSKETITEGQGMVKSVTNIPASKSMSALGSRPLGSSDVSLPDQIKELTLAETSSTSPAPPKRKSLSYFGFRTGSSAASPNPDQGMYTDLPSTETSVSPTLKRKQSIPFFGGASSTLIRHKSIDAGSSQNGKAGHRDVSSKQVALSSSWKKWTIGSWNPVRSVPSPPPSTSSRSPSLVEKPLSISRPSLESKRSLIGTPVSVSESLPILISTPSASIRSSVSSGVTGSATGKSMTGKSIWGFLKKVSAKAYAKTSSSSSADQLNSINGVSALQPNGGDQQRPDAISVEQQEFEMALKRPEARRAFFEKETKQLNGVSDTTRNLFADLCVADLDFDELLRRYDAGDKNSNQTSSESRRIDDNTQTIKDITLLRNVREARTRETIAEHVGIAQSLLSN